MDRLIHFTRRFEGLRSIATHGLLFTYNPTGVLHRLFGEDFRFVEAPNPGGMICFTARPIHRANALSASLGRFAVEIDQEWAVDRGARPVVYKRVADDAELQALRNRLLKGRIEAAFPSEGQHLVRWLQEVVATQPAFAQSLGMEDDFLQLQHASRWFETYDNRDESEWRILAPPAYPNIEVLLPEERVTYLLRMLNVPGLARSLALKITPEAKPTFYVPAMRALAFEECLERTPLRGCQVVPCPARNY